MNKNKKTERKKTTQNHALAFSETRGPAVPQCCLLQAAGSTGCGVRGTAQADRGVWGPEISQGPESSGEQILCAYPPKATQQPCVLLQSFHFCSMVWDSLKTSKLVYFQTICQYKKHRMGFGGCLSETDDTYVYNIRFAWDLFPNTHTCPFLNNLALVLTLTQLKTTLRKWNKLLDFEIFAMDVVVWWYFTTGSMELENLWFVPFAVFCGVSIPTKANFVLPLYSQQIWNWEGEKMQKIVTE